jgi:hypothetical protein
MGTSHSASVRRLWVAALALAALVGTAGPGWAQYGPGGRIDGKLGVVERCDNFFADSLFSFPLGYLPWIGAIFDNHDTPDPAAVLVRRGDFSLPRFRNATGRIVEGAHVGDYPAGQFGDESVVNYQDFPDVHDSHDQNFFLRLDPDPGQADIISTFGIDSTGKKPADAGYAPDTLEVEWETGILTSQFTGDGRFFPKWAWPLPGDRVWVNGYWIFDCGHAVENTATGSKGLRS